MHLDISCCKLAIIGSILPQNKSTEMDCNFINFQSGEMRLARI